MLLLNLIFLPVIISHFESLIIVCGQNKEKSKKTTLDAEFSKGAKDIGNSFARRFGTPIASIIQTNMFSIL